MTEPLLRVEHLTHCFGRRKAVEDVSFHIEPGEVFALVGESGCGKTTTGRCILGLYTPTEGNIHFRGERIVAGTCQQRRRLHQLIKHPMKNKKRIAEAYGLLREAKKINAARRQNTTAQIQMIFQDPVASLDPRMTVGEIIAEGLRIRGVKDQAYIRQQVHEMLELVGLSQDHTDRYPHEFSGGQRQRISIARSLVLRPSLLIADEPLSALDVSVQAQVLNLLEGLRQHLGLSILFIAHDLAVVRQFAHRIGVMYRGRLVEEATKTELFAHPVHPYTRLLLAAIPVPDPAVGDRHVLWQPEEAWIEKNAAMQQIAPGHWVLCGPEQAEIYRKERGHEG